MRQLDSITVYNAYLLGAKKVIEHKNLLNKINVFPVADGDTGSNLFSMMNSIIHEAKIGNTVKRTMESIAEAALMGARGNSGLIFAGYLGGMSRAIWDEEIISIENFAHANQEAVRYAYEAIENPVEGTMITLMKEWAKHLNELVKEGEFSEKPLIEIEERLEYTLSLTKDQLPELKKAGFDAVLIRGISAKPVYLWIHDGQAELRDAGHLWGKDCPETEEALANELGDAKVSAAVIGLPGEQCAWLAGIMNDRHRAAAP